MADAEQKVTTSDLAGATRTPDDSKDRRDVRPDRPSNEPVEEDRRDQRDRLDAERRDREGASSSTNGSAAPAEGDAETTALLDGDAANQLQERWTEIQVDFVDKPRDAVSRADELVAQVMQQLASRFADERNSLESQWSSGDDVDTEDLRVALQRYRSFFRRLLSA